MFISTIGFLVIAALVIGFLNWAADRMESNRGDREIREALAKWHKEHPNAPEPTIRLKGEK